MTNSETRTRKPGAGAEARRRLATIDRRIEFLASIRRFAAQSAAYTWLRESVLDERPDLRTSERVRVPGTTEEHVAAIAERLGYLRTAIGAAKEQSTQDQGAEREAKAIAWAAELLRNRIPELSALAAPPTTAADNQYAASTSQHGRKRIATLQRRADFLASVIAEAGGEANTRDTAEESAIRWTLTKITELRARLDAIDALAAARMETGLHAAIQSLAAEHPSTVPGLVSGAAQARSGDGRSSIGSTSAPVGRSPATAPLLAGLDSLAHETTRMLAILDESQGIASDRREVKRRVMEIRERAHELIEWLSEVRMEEPRN